MSTIQNKKIVAKEYPLKDILSNNKYSIDYFQREYRWRKENIDQLIDELNKNTDSIVKIVENQASLKAYNTLIDRLNENKISYIDYTIGKGETTE